MEKFKLIFVGCVIGLIVVIGSIVIWLTLPKLAPLRPTQKSFPQKAVDILPKLPVPDQMVLNNSSMGDATDSEIVFVPRVIDGDTIVVEPVDRKTGRLGEQETVRYIGMDTPETVSPTKPVECYGHEASARNKELVDGKYVEIVKDVSDKDKYGRLLRFVYLLNGSSSVDLELVKEGYARVLTIPPDIEFKNDFIAFAAAAKSAGLGFWGACPSYPFK